MASYTTNLNLKKPAGSENVAIGDINNNMDTIDQAYGTLNSKFATVDVAKTINGVYYETAKKDNIIMVTAAGGSVTNAINAGDTIISLSDIDSSWTGLKCVSNSNAFFLDSSGNMHRIYVTNNAGYIKTIDAIGAGLNLRFSIIMFTR